MLYREAGVLLVSLHLLLLSQRSWREGCDLCLRISAYDTLRSYNGVDFVTHATLLFGLVLWFTHVQSHQQTSQRHNHVMTCFAHFDILHDGGM